jgi:hypothetical protein
MNIAFLHYHLKPGGVTTVIRQQIKALQNDCDALVLTGEPPGSENPFPCDTAVIPGIGYDTPGKAPVSPNSVAGLVLDAIFSKWKDGCDLLHVHNPLLAKNRNFLKILALLQYRGIRLFLQVHDFAEDGRPWTYYVKDPYPADCHYGVINSRDHQILLKAGLKKKGLHSIPNMVNPLDIRPEAVIPENFVLYPVRAIPRKNIGEALLLSLFFKNREVLAITLPPNSPRDLNRYQNWKNFAAGHHLKVMFEASDRYAFLDLVRSATCIISTSITEGFGFAFLEPWTAGQPLAGRMLEVCGDFTKNGVLLDHLYSKIHIPVEDLDTKRLQDKWAACMLKNARRFGLEMHPSEAVKGFQTVIADGRIDFALIDETAQQQVLLNLLFDTGFRKKLLRINPFLPEVTTLPDQAARIARNKTAVLTRYNETVYRTNLLTTYKKVMKGRVLQRIDKQALASAFLKPETFSLLKWHDHDV